MRIRLLILLLCAEGLLTGLSAQVAFPALQKEIIIDKGLYRFSDFTTGKVVFLGGKYSSVMLNYNISLDEMHFIDPKGDTLAVANPASIRFINMNGNRFYYDKGWLQIIDTAKGLILAFRQVLSKSKPLQKNGYETMKPNEFAGSETFFTGNGQKFGQGYNDLFTLSAREYYFFGDENGHFTKTRRTYLLYYFNKQRDAIEAFLKANPANFNTLEDLLKVLAFCKQLE
jgi:hypothetical protein